MGVGRFGSAGCHRRSVWSSCRDRFRGRCRAGRQGKAASCSIGSSSSSYPRNAECSVRWLGRFRGCSSSWTVRSSWCWIHLELGVICKVRSGGAHLAHAAGLRWRIGDRRRSHEMRLAAGNNRWRFRTHTWLVRNRLALIAIIIGCFAGGIRRPIWLGNISRELTGELLLDMRVIDQGGIWLNGHRWGNRRQVRIAGLSSRPFPTTVARLYSVVFQLCPLNPLRPGPFTLTALRSVPVASARTAPIPVANLGISIATAFFIGISAFECPFNNYPIVLDRDARFCRRIARSDRIARCAGSVSLAAAA